MLLAASATEGFFSLWRKPAFPVSFCSVMRMVIVIYWTRISAATSDFERLSLGFSESDARSPLKNKTNHPMASCHRFLS